MGDSKNTEDTPEPFPGISSGGLSGNTGADRLGSDIGPYKLLRVLGEGGYGVVYLAEQREPVKRRVALKLIKPGMDSKEVLARFEAERQALALLDHPNIAHVFDAGTSSSDHPYFAMEYVDGASITEYCDHHKLSIEDRLQLFIEVCRAIQHAHEKGIIHRDIKPSNILVSLQGQKAVPKVIDFGVVKAMSLPLTERTLFTERGQLLGTPEYMSPEQADMAVQNIDTRSDIYSLGAVLYVLLTGALPFDRKSLERAGFAEIQRILREQDPPRPSTRLSILGEEAEKIAKSRNTQVLTLTRRLQKELEWIPLKAMRKERERRYRTVLEFADDVENYLKGAPLIAGPESTLYRFRKFVRRHSTSVAAALVVVLALALGLVISSMMYFRAEGAREKEATARYQAQQSENFAQEKAEDYRRSLYFNRIALAESTYRDGSMGDVRELLELCPVDLHGWEWFRLSHISDQALMNLRGHKSIIYSVSFSPDGKRIISCGRDQTIRVWDVESGDEVMILRGHKGSVTDVSFSPNGKRIVSCSTDQTIKVWDAIKGIELMTLRGHKASVRDVSFNPDGKRIVSCSYNDIKVWDTATGRETITIHGHEGRIRSVTFSPNGKQIASGSSDQTVRLWDAASGNQLMEFSGHKIRVRCVAFSPDGKRIASSGFGKTVKLWDTQKGSELMELRGHEDFIWSVDFNPDGKRIVSSGSFDNTIKIWDATTGEELMSLRGHDGLIVDASFSPDGKKIVSCANDATIKVWDAVISKEMLTLHGYKGRVDYIAFSPDGTKIASSGNGETVKLWDVVNGAELMSLRGHFDSVPSVSFSPDGKRIITGSHDKTAKIWDAASGNEIITLLGHEEGINCVAFSPSSKQVISGSEDETLKIWDAATGKEVMTLMGHRSSVEFVTYMQDGELILSGSWDGTIKIWDTTTGTEVRTLRGHTGGVMSIVCSPNGQQFVSAGEDEVARLWDIASGREVMTIGREKESITCAIFSQDCMRIVSSSMYDDAIKVWDATTGALAMTLRIPNEGCMAFSPDGKTLAIGSNGNVMLLESEVHVEGYGLRRSAESARVIVEQLYQKHGFYNKVINELQTFMKLDEDIKHIAVQIAESRRWEDTDKLITESWIVVISPDKSKENYLEALNKVEMAIRLEPNYWHNLLSLGMAHYRVGEFEDALKALRQYEKHVLTADSDRDCLNSAFIAMSLYQLGHIEEAQATLDLLYSSPLDPRWKPGQKVGPFAPRAPLVLIEAGKLVADNDGLNSVWNCIEAGNLEQASVLLDGLHSTSGRDDVALSKQIKGISEWLGRIYYNRAENIWSSYLDYEPYPDYEIKINDYEKAVHFAPDYAVALNSLAWLRATCPSADFRDGSKAVKAATKACELTNFKNHEYISTLAAAYSELGYFEEAIKWQEEAIKILPETDWMELKVNYDTRLNLYKTQKPYSKGSLWSFSNGKLAGWWKLDKAENGKVVDSSGNDLDGKLIGDSQIISDPERGNVLALDGDGDYIDCGQSSSFNMTSSITVVCWIKVNKFDKQWHTIVAKGDYNCWWLSRNRDNNSLLFLSSLEDRYYITSFRASGSINVNDQKWHHVAGVYDGNKIYLYVDGILDDFIHAGGNIPTNNAPVYIGGKVATYGGDWNGLIDDVRIYSYALSEAEVKDLYNGNDPPRVKE